ncbi:MAG: hypothetical protein LBV06_11185 [Propionibacteriaceae bacterium]|nr:hypothetical protein [Propionibacteriaceae bacterium]
MNWIIVFVAIAVLGAVVTWLSGRRLWSSWRGLTDEVAASLTTLGQAGQFMNDLGTPSDAYAQARREQVPMAQIVERRAESGAVSSSRRQRGLTAQPAQSDLATTGAPPTGAGSRRSWSVTVRRGPDER